MGHLHAPLHGSKAPAWILGGQARQRNLRDQMGMKQRLIRAEMIPSVYVWQQIYLLWGRLGRLDSALGDTSTAPGRIHERPHGCWGVSTVLQGQPGHPPTSRQPASYKPSRTERGWGGGLGPSSILWLQASTHHPTLRPYSAGPPPPADPRNL